MRARLGWVVCVSVDEEEDEDEGAVGFSMYVKEGLASKMTAYNSRDCM